MQKYKKHTKRFWASVVYICILLLAMPALYALGEQLRLSLPPAEPIVQPDNLKLASLTVVPVPTNATIRNLSIEPAYRAGMPLAPGDYVIEVSAPGYKTRRKTIALKRGDNLRVQIRLTPITTYTDKVVDNKQKKKRSDAKHLVREGVFGKAWKDPKTGMAFVWVPGGTFDMGDTFGDGYKDEKPVHKVTVDGFYMGKYEVTQEEWVKVMKSNPSGFKKGDRYPVENVSWDMIIKQFIPELNKISDQTYRLPTEAEWEYAARSGGKKEKYAGGDDVDALAWYDDNSNGSTHEVGTKAPNGLGLYNMSGNVWEWCEDDWYNNYDGAPDDGTAWMDSPRGAGRVVRGGSWDHSARGVRSASRSGPGRRRSNLGFRLVFQAVK
ncbi:SUMF1/EgtB/PvdO family nonheme iron enzyme [Desulfobacter latus]|uniref:SUMF1/EgtB/PvdO family nonheme iron enzyme n=1 Tax=Desulfobacter latus TaxID=2292 RepID=A0A850SXD7_9BACT|nr:formylglycine-generating enzyme family protein [Desulfobacter latus]NWH04810.1 SUMF1/EgtB/PvdO family nonheme iron enzyme [Desulfobacter latus]